MLNNFISSLPLLNLKLLLIVVSSFILSVNSQSVPLTEVEQAFIEQHPQVKIAGTSDSAPLLIRKLDGIDVSKHYNRDLIPV